jgi:hypothetical protein
MTDEKKIHKMKGARAFPNAIDGTPQSFNERGDDDDNDDDEQQAAKSLPTPVQGDELDRIIFEACEQVQELKAERKEINAKIQALNKSLEARGIPAVAFKHVLATIEMTEDQRLAMDLGVMILRKAVKIPVQSDMFDSAA